MSAPPKSHKRKRSRIHDTPVDLTKMQLARQRLSALQEELRDIEETEAEMAEIMKHVDALQGILGSTKKLITRIHRSTSKRKKKEKLPVAIFPEMRIASGDGVLVKNTVNQFEVWLTGNVDYGVLEAPLDDLMMYTGNCIMLVEAKRDKEMLVDCMPEATSQAIALSEVTGNNTVRYCLSDGTKWMFQVYTSDAQGNHISYEPLLTIVQPHLEVGEDFKKDVQCLVELLYHWLRTDGNIKNDPLCTV
ncbi:hypothetical protein F5887DRAFT_923809 [Amanita rubescens]|nr:hypothetical protein F5887DRAFT_923809 [Amanita rubescens]